MVLLCKAALVAALSFWGYADAKKPRNFRGR